MFETTRSGLQTPPLLWSGPLNNSCYLGIFHVIPMYGSGNVFTPSSMSSEADMPFFSVAPNLL